MTQSKLKIYYYPNAKDHVHDLDINYINTVPFSKLGISTYCELTSPENADFFYMGQFSYDRDKNFTTKDFKFFESSKEKHIIDLEGDGGFDIPEELFNSIITVNGPKAIYDPKIKNLFVRPTFSTLLLDICRNRFEEFNYNLNRKFCFQGFINSQIRYNMFIKLLNQNKLLVELKYNNNWSGPSIVGSDIQKTYEQMIKRNAFSLCPRGSGLDSVRLLESCYYGRVPILISDIDYLLVDHKYADTSFIPRIISSSLDELIVKLELLINLNNEDIINIQQLAYNYFNSVIRKYLLDPTGYMIDWMKKQKLL